MAHHIAGNCSNQVRGDESNDKAFKGRAVQKLIDPTQRLLLIILFPILCDFTLSISL